METPRIYFDNNATTPLAPQVRAQLATWAEAFGNPSSIHWAGRGPKALIREARRNFADLIGAETLEIIFTATGSEANNHALKGIFWSYQKSKSPRNHYLISAVEHPSILRAAEFLRDQGAEVEIFPVGRGGAVDLIDFEKRLRPTTALVSMMFANNETGTLFPIKKMAKLTHQVGALFHSDCVQSLGKSLINVKDLGVDLATFSGHKFYSLKGAGALYSQRGTKIESLIHGGGQERHRRAGTENVLAIASLGAMALEKNNLPEKLQHLNLLRDHFEGRVLGEIEHVIVTGLKTKRVPNTSSLVLDQVGGESLLMNLDMQGFAVSTGAACSSGSPEPSPALIAMGLTRLEAQSSLRVSFGWQNTLDEVNAFVEVLKKNRFSYSRI